MCCGAAPLSCHSPFRDVTQVRGIIKCMARPVEQVAPERAVALLLIDPFGAILLQLRDANTLFSPNKWAATGGSLETDEDPEHGARRELLEETGLSAEGTLSLVIRNVWAASYGVGWTE